MNEQNRESRRQRLIHALAEEAVKLVVSGQFNEQGAVNAAMNTFRNDVLDQRKKLFGPVIKEVRNRLKQAASQNTKAIVKEPTSQPDTDRDIMMRDAARLEAERIRLNQELGIEDPGSNE